MESDRDKCSVWRVYVAGDELVGADAVAVCFVVSGVELLGVSEEDTRGCGGALLT